MARWEKHILSTNRIWLFLFHKMSSFTPPPPPQLLPESNFCCFQTDYGFCFISCSTGLHFGSKKNAIISIVFEDLSRNWSPVDFVSNHIPFPFIYSPANIVLTYQWPVTRAFVLFLTLLPVALILSRFAVWDGLKQIYLKARDKIRILRDIININLHGLFFVAISININFHGLFFHNFLQYSRKIVIFIICVSFSSFVCCHFHCNVLHFSPSGSQWKTSALRRPRSALWTTQQGQLAWWRWLETLHQGEWHIPCKPFYPESWCVSLQISE